ncbi:DUF992 domain-containing protein [Pseudoruegeria sp. SK021]|uniref:DUF992 domain-containing protein n=1 Tax=Pseudoruegeria sp. SK021 TaxID=1933035 RepID=UPI000A24783F|nr:DUF992 domain-containing protein [Pseudoruegeria sp. SK021]OSP54050.1 hypothetical protein BV911_14640 [Pseudoruegeria sp. SK021]
MKTLSAFACMATLCASAAFADDAADKSDKTEKGAQIGVLTCTMTDVTNVIVYTDEKFDCSYEPKEGDVQTYKGVMKSVGLNLSVTKGATMVWGVVAPSMDLDSATILKGKYVGGTGKVEIGGGVAANVLIGGGSDSITLQPFSVSGLTGFGAALDVSYFELM